VFPKPQPGGNRAVGGSSAGDQEDATAGQKCQHNTDSAVAELYHGCERAVRDHYFAIVYPREIRARARRLVEFVALIEHRALTGSHHTLDFLDKIALPLFESAAGELADMMRRPRRDDKGAS
jgi:hypothetical protein